MKTGLLGPVAGTVVVVGNGMVSQRFCDQLRRRTNAQTTRIIVFGEEPWPAYDRVQLTKYFQLSSADPLLLATRTWYANNDIELRTSAKITRVDLDAREVVTESGERCAYDHLVLATGSSAFVPRMPGIERPGVFVYRTLEDLDAIRAYAQGATRCAVLGGGLLGLEAARAVQECGVTTHVVEMADRLMPRQLDAIGGRLLRREIERMGVPVHVGCATREVLGDPAVTGLLTQTDELPFDMVVVSAGIRPRDELAREAGIAVGERGGIQVDDSLATSAPDVYAIGECALHRGMIYGLVAPGYEMAEVLARALTGEPEARFEGADLSCKLKLMGVDVASFGDPFADESRSDAQVVAFQDFTSGVYKKLILDGSAQHVLGGMLLGDASAYGTLTHYARSGEPIPGTPEELLLGARGGGAATGLAALPDAAQVCSCNNVSKGAILQAVSGGACELSALKSCTKAGTSCGGCLPQVVDLLDMGLAAMGRSTRKRLCEHFDLTRRELFDVVRVRGIDTFEELLREHGTGGHGCEVCKPTAASIFASLQNEMILSKHATLQDTNDRFLANIQRRGLYSVVPRIPGGEITPEGLIRLGEIAQRYGLYTKITGGQRVDMFGATLEKLPDIWEELVESGFESGHAYAKGLRTVKSCVGSTWCRYGIDDSVGLAIRLEERYRGIRAPHKLKSAVSGCVRECAEAQSKDFGVIATESGWNLYVCGNGGAKPRHADLLATDLDEPTLIRYIDRFLMYYMCTADRLTRTSVWLDKLEGGIEHVRDVVVHDTLGLGAELEQMAAHLVETYQCEWAAVVRDPEQRARFRHFANSDDPDDNVFMIEQRGQHRVADWDPPAAPRKLRLPVVTTTEGGVAKDELVYFGEADAFPAEGGMAVRHGEVQLAIYHFASRGEWYATQNMCPHQEDMVLARGLLGDAKGEPKVVCPMHKKSFSLVSGECLSGEDYQIMTFPVEVQDGRVFARVPPASALADQLCAARSSCHAHAAE
ncbi:MAG: nitrite reductase large subunit NirB [Myxococcales bacterium]|nr:nitrite reductase large subunit NirB [Myxococcales bacterium]